MCFVYGLYWYEGHPEIPIGTNDPDAVRILDSDERVLNLTNKDIGLVFITRFTFTIYYYYTPL